MTKRLSPICTVLAVALALAACQTTGNDEAEFELANNAGFDEETGAALPLELPATDNDTSNTVNVTGRDDEVGSGASGNWDPERYSVLPVAPNERPQSGTDEAGLWVAYEGYEDQLRQSARLVTDPRVQSYISDVVCRVAGPYCGDIRVYVVDNPVFNAAMLGNGAMIIHTGFLIRAVSEAQIASVIGHEIGHYLLRHGILRHRRRVDTAAGLLAFGIVAGAAGVGALSDVAGIAASGAFFEYNRDQERQSDGYGYALMLRAGYDPREGPEIWSILIDEAEAAGREETMFFQRTHPLSSERLEVGRRVTAEMYETADEDLETGAERYYEFLLPIRAEYFQQQLELADFKAFGVLLDTWRNVGIRNGEVEFFQGEVHRLRGDSDEDEKDNEADTDVAESESLDSNSAALESYRLALTLDGAPPRIHRSLGVLLNRMDRPDEAREHFQTYLNLVPDATDRPLIELMIQELTS